MIMQFSIDRYLHNAALEISFSGLENFQDEENSAATQRHNELKERFATLPIATYVKQTSEPLFMIKQRYVDRYLHSAALQTGF
ncbi:conserved hypothetical protein [Trichinella spiralis]|uniref:hypothetical protein n=1 Tax=Trichinella spiralis TaxID=6334 RepID=UPI0001EFCBA6|nr:conserved hypothetical protein [Trichinella spiralis]